MNSQDPLANLQPLRTPELIGWWPLAPGWWVLIVLMLAGLSTLIYLLVRHYRRNAYRRRALRQLQRLQDEFTANNDGQRLLTKTNALLKSVALLAYPRYDVAARHGAQWAAFLNSTLQSGTPFAEEFATAIYQEHGAPVDTTQLIDATQHWIKHHRVTS